MVLAMDNNKMMTKAGSGHQCNTQPMTGAAKVGGGWGQDRLRAGVNNWRQKRLAMTALMVAQWHVMTKVNGGGGQ
jgi:hypothetical protein